MADPQYHDADGNPITVSAQPQFHDSEGKPISAISPSEIPGRAVVTRGTPESGYQTSQLERTDTAKGKVAPFAGRVAAEALPAIGSFAGPGGTLAGTGLMLAAKRADPQTFGEYSPDIMDQVGTATKQLLLNNAFPAGLGKLGELVSGGKAGLATKLSNFPAVRDAAVSRYGEQVQQMLSPEVTNAGKFQLMPDYQPVGSHTPIEIRPTGLRGTQTIAKGPVVPSDLKLGDMVSGSKINADKALGEMTGPNAARYADSMAPETYGAIKDLLGTMKDMQKTTTLDRIINYREGRLVWGGYHAGVAGALFAGHPLAGAVAESPIILNAVLGKIMQNPETAKLVTAALQTPASAPQASMLNHALSVALTRATIEGAGISSVPER